MLRAMIGAVSVTVALSLIGGAAAAERDVDGTNKAEAAKSANPNAGTVPALVRTPEAQAVDAARIPAGDKSWKSVGDPLWRFRPEGADRDAGGGRR